jgi:2'-5' RNA ligase
MFYTLAGEFKMPKLLEAQTAFERNVRVYAQSTLEPRSQQRLEALQDVLREKYGRDRARLSRNLHLTLMHLGKPRELMEGIRDHNPDITRDAFTDALDAFIKRSRNLIPDAYSLATDGFDWFGSKREVLALRLEPDEQYREAHEMAVKAVKMFLHKCGVPDPDAYARWDSNLKHMHTVSPHITLLRSVKSQELPAPEQAPDSIDLEPITIIDPTQD